MIPSGWASHCCKYNGWVKLPSCGEQEWHEEPSVGGMVEAASMIVISGGCGFGTWSAGHG